MELSEWMVVDEYCATRVLKGTDHRKVENRVAFIEKTARVRVKPFTEKDDSLNWWQAPFKGSYMGFDQESRDWCDKRLKGLGYTF